MTGFQRTAAALAAAASLAAGCGSAAPESRAGTPMAIPPSLATSVTTAGGTWAVLLMGGSAARHNNFWELFTRPPGTTAWRLVTPPGVASNGGLVAAPAGGRSATVAFRPSQGLTFTPLATTTDGGATWPATGILDARLAAQPAALTASARDGRLLALLTDGTAETSPRGAAHWTTLVTRRSLASTAAGRRCGTGSPSAGAFGASGTPVLAAACTRARAAGIFAFSGGTWRLAGPSLPAPLAAPVGVLGLWDTGAGLAALLTARSARGTAVVAAWARGGRWMLSRPLLAGARVRSVSAGTGGAMGLILNDRTGVTVAAPGAAWHRLPRLPDGTQALALGPGGRVDALTAVGKVVTDWAWHSAPAGWARAQVLHVPVQYGTSG